MLDKFNGVIYLSIFIVHFIVYAVYAFRTVVATKSFLNQYNIDDSAAVMVRFFGAPFIASILVALYICLLYTSPSPRDRTRSRMPSSA